MFSIAGGVDLVMREDPEVLVISREIYLALHPIEQIMAQALQKYKKVKIL
jgi:hypothetical protein